MGVVKEQDEGEDEPLVRRRVRAKLEEGDREARRESLPVLAVEETLEQEGGRRATSGHGTVMSSPSIKSESWRRASAPRTMRKVSGMFAGCL